MTTVQYSVVPTGNRPGASQHLGAAGAVTGVIVARIIESGHVMVARIMANGNLMRCQYNEVAVRAKRASEKNTINVSRRDSVQSLSSSGCMAWDLA